MRLRTALLVLLLGSVAAALAQVSYQSEIIIVASGGHPTLTTGACSGSSPAGGLTGGTFVAASCSSSTYILSALPAVPTGYVCEARDRTTTADALTETATTTTSVTFTGTTAASDVIQFMCPMAY